MNQAVELQAQTPEALVKVERPMPEPGRNQIVVRIHAASLNSRDIQIAGGWYWERPDFPLIPLSDGAGEVVALGPDVRDVALGDRVAGTFWRRWDGGGVDMLDASSSLGSPLPGVLQQYVLFEERSVVKIPSHLSYEEASTLPCAALTAWYSLVTCGRIKAGDSVLIQGTGGVSIFALQFALLAGAQPIVTSRSDEKLARANDLGAAVGINTVRTPDWERAVVEATNGAGVDHVIEIGGPNTMTRSLAALKAGGQINVIGYLAGKEGAVNPLDILAKRATVRGIPVGSREAFEAMNAAITANALRPVIDRVFSWNEIRAAYAYLESGAQFGKVVVRLDE